VAHGAAGTLRRSQFLFGSPGEQPGLHVFAGDVMSGGDLSLGLEHFCQQGFASWRLVVRRILSSTECARCATPSVKMWSRVTSRASLSHSNDHPPIKVLRLPMTLQGRLKPRSIPQARLPAPGLQQMLLIQCGNGEAFHRSSQVLADFK
jgi:hypothetical protein